ncbi:MAG: hypothetical protein Tsb009_38270 [Planctomycetaceae bacterium]
MNYQVKPIGKTCEATGQPLVPGTICHSVLLERDGKVVRLDYADENWTGPPENAIGCWKTIVPDVETSQPKQLDPDSLFHCFEQMCEDANPAQDKLRYVLALLLIQKKRLKIENSYHDGESEVMELIGSGGEGPFEMRDQNLQPEEIEELQRELKGSMFGESE